MRATERAKSVHTCGRYWGIDDEILHYVLFEQVYAMMAVGQNDYIQVLRGDWVVKNIIEVGYCERASNSFRFWVSDYEWSADDDRALPCIR